MLKLLTQNYVMNNDLDNILIIINGYHFYFTSMRYDAEMQIMSATGFGYSVYVMSLQLECYLIVKKILNVKFYSFFPIFTDWMQAINWLNKENKQLGEQGKWIEMRQTYVLLCYKVCVI